jgi:hypothetical protein
MSSVNPSGDLELDTEEFFRSLNRATSVLHIANFDGLKKCNINDAVKVIESEEYSPFDFIGVSDGTSVVGLLDRRAARVANGDHISEIYDSLSERNLISEESGVLEFLLKANSSPARLVLSGDEIKGIVTIADLQKLPVRTAVFAMIMHLELLMTGVLRSLYAEKDDIFNLIPSATRRADLRKKYQELIKSDMCIDQFGALYFCDKRDLLCTQNKYFESSKNRIRSDLKSIEKARNSLAHGGDYTLTRKTTNEFICAARRCKEWIDKLQDFPHQ